MSTLATTTVTARAPVDLGNGTSVLITPWPEAVQLEFYENAKAASEEYLKKANLSYDEYENLRQQNPQANLPELKKPQESDKNPNSGAARISPPAAVSLTPNVRQARVYTMPLLQPPEPPPYQPQGVVENAEHVGGMVVGAAKAVGSGLLAAASYVSDSIWQLGDLLTAGYFRDSGLVQGVLQRQNNRGGAIVNAAQHPIDTATAVLNDLRARQQQAEALRAAGDFYEAGKISGTILVDVYPGSGAAAGMVKKLPHGEHLPTPKHGSDGVAILRRKPTGGAWDYAPNWEKWQERGGTVTPHADGSVTYTRKDGISVIYDKDGYPDFSPHAIESVQVDGLQFNRTTDFDAANNAAGTQGGRTPEGYTWHHHQDGRTMQLIPQGIGLVA